MRLSTTFRCFILILCGITGISSAQTKPRLPSELIRKPGVMQAWAKFLQAQANTSREIEKDVKQGDLHAAYEDFLALDRFAARQPKELQEMLHTFKMQDGGLEKWGQFEFARSMAELEVQQTRASGYRSLVKLARMSKTQFGNQAKEALHKNRKDPSLKAVVEELKKSGK